MEEKTPNTLEKIQQAALDEFSEKGFSRHPPADLKHAGSTSRSLCIVTFQQSAFASIVEPHAAALTGKYMSPHHL